jgi:hypothetical protein
MSTPLYGPAFALDRLAAETPPTVPKHLMPWLLKDRREAVEGCYVRRPGEVLELDGSGLEKAERNVRQLESQLAGPSLSVDMQAILRVQLEGARGAVEFWRGKVYLLDRIIGRTHAGL